MYYEYWGMKKPAFDNVPDPSMYVDCHTSMENAIAETLFAIKEGDECIAVIVGDVGLGKTMSIRMIIDALDQDKYKIALITNPGISFVQILQEIIGQLTGKQCEEKRKVSLLEIFNHLLFSTLGEGRKILIFIDEANAITPMNLENLRLLTNMQGDKRNLFTMVLAGQIEFARRLEHPKRANLFQRVGTYSRIDKLESIDQIRKYAETRVILAGATKRVFADDAFDILWEQSDHGVPRLVNKLSKLCLKAGETNQFELITGEIVEQIGSRFHKLTGPVIQKRRSRRCIPTEVQPEDDLKRDRNEVADVTAAEQRGPDRIEDEETAITAQEPLMQEARAAGGEAPAPAVEDVMSITPQQSSLEESEYAKRDSEAEMCIGHVRIKINFPEHLMKQSLSSSQEHRFKLAGGIAAETLRKYPHLITSDSTDPVPIWLEIRDFVLNRITHASHM
jgi:type II secretory pathway predicted ATPase ExeA